ncbi:MAG: replicative DNA helicase [Elusimicrobiaceae bacterium]|nr:replicative DNA helicase [Elusimicrobiaceae bacterium]
MINEKLPPQALDAEMALLGSMMIEQDALERAISIVSVEHFYKTAHQKIFTAMKNLAVKDKAVDLITLTEELKKQGFLAEIGGERYLADLMSKVSTAAHVEHYAKIVYDTAMLRELIKISTSTVENCYKNAEQEPSNLIDEAQAKLFSLNQKQERRGFVASKDMALEAMDQIEKLIIDKNPIKGVPTGFTKFDTMTGGLRKSDLIILAARPSQGKTAMALNIVQNALDKGYPVAMFSLEMGRFQIYQRMVCTAAQVSLINVSNGTFQKSRWRELASKVQKLGEQPLFIDDTPGITITEIRMRARRLARELQKQGKELGLIVIDYIGLITTGKAKIENRQQEVSEISRMLKELARTMNVPVLVLSQLNRNNEKGRDDKRPQLSDLRESGSIEQDADVVALIHREGYYKREDETLKNKAELILAKQRNGPVGKIDLNWFSEYTLFTNPALVSDEAVEETSYATQGDIPL